MTPQTRSNSCTDCSKPGSSRLNKGYEVAHIYPLHPTPSQVTALIGRAAPQDINALENVIALCPSCHTKYDKDFKLEEMDKLRKIKDGFLAVARANATVSDYKIQEEVYAILDSITSLTSTSHGSFVRRHGRSLSSAPPHASSATVMRSSPRGTT